MRCLGFLGVFLGLSILVLAVRADDLGFGQFAGLGQRHYEVAIVGAAMAGGSLLLVIAPKRR